MTFNRDRVALDALDARLTQIASRLLPGATGAAEGNSVTLQALFADDSERTERLSLSMGELHLTFKVSPSSLAKAFLQHEQHGWLYCKIEFHC
mgnify:CR=1 FL=1